MAQIYRDVAISQMIATTEEAMSHAIDWWGDLPISMKEAIDEFRVQLGAAIDSVEFVKRALDRSVPETSWKGEQKPADETHRGDTKRNSAIVFRPRGLSQRIAQAEQDSGEDGGSPN